MKFLGFLFWVLIVAVVLGAFVYAWWWHQHGEGKAMRLRHEAEARKRGPRLHMNGWRYDDTRDGDVRYRVHGTSAGGLSWVVEYDSDHSSSSSSPKLRFQIESLGDDDYAWQIIDRWSFDLARRGVGGALVGGLAAIGGALSKRFAKKCDFWLSADERPVGTAALRERFVLIAESARYDSLIDGEIENRILVWPDFKPSMSKPDNCLSAGLGPEGLEVKLYVDGPRVEVIEQVIRLGEALADGSRRLLRDPVS